MYHVSAYIEYIKVGRPSPSHFAMLQSNLGLHTHLSQNADAVLTSRDQERNFGLKSGGTNSEGERGALGS